jgi:hypothetical protein
MLSRAKSLTAVALVLLICGSASSIPLPLPILPPPQYLIQRPDLVIREIKAHYDPYFQETVIELRVKNRGNKAVNARVLLTGTVTYGDQTDDMQWAVDMSLQPGDSHTYYLGAIQIKPATVTVSAMVDTPVWPQIVGTVWESDEGNNTRSRQLGLSANGFDYGEL